MADASDIATVRLQTAQTENVPPYDDVYVGALIDASGVTGATIIIYEQLMAKYSKLVDVTEAGASHKFSDLYSQARKQADYYRSIDGTTLPDVLPAVRVKKIVRA